MVVGNQPGKRTNHHILSDYDTTTCIDEGMLIDRSPGAYPKMCAESAQINMAVQINFVAKFHSSRAWSIDHAAATYGAFPSDTYVPWKFKDRQGGHLAAQSDFPENDVQQLG